MLDRWFEDPVRPRLQGKAHLVRYADDFVIGFENKLDAERAMEVLPKPRWLCQQRIALRERKTFLHGS